MNTEAVSTAGKPSSRGALVAALSAVGSVLAALTWCLPVLPFVLAAGTVSSARFFSSYVGALWLSADDGSILCAEDAD